MSKQLDTIQGCNVIHRIDSDSTEAFLLKIAGCNKPTKHSYYELIKNDKVEQVIQDEDVALSVAGKYGYDYRRVEFEVSFELVNKEEAKQ